MKLKNCLAAASLTFFLATPSPVRSEKWELVTEREVDVSDYIPYKEFYYLDIDSAYKVDDKIRIWHKNQTDISDVSPYDPSPNIFEALYEYDCAAGTRALIRWEEFLDDRPIKVFGWEGGREKHRAVQQGSIGEKLLRAVCAIK